MVTKPWIYSIVQLMQLDWKIDMKKFFSILNRSLLQIFSVVIMCAAGVVFGNNLVYERYDMAIVAILIYCSALWVWNCNKPQGEGKAK